MRDGVRAVNFLEELYGDVAVVVICGVLFANEAGVPMPTTGELILIAGGILVGAGALEPWLFVPLAAVAAVGGAFAGYSWARLIGEGGLQSVAERIGQGRRLAKLSDRLGRAGPLRIALYRLTPGFRVYTSLVAGAAGVDRRRFLIGVGPLTVLWVTTFTVVGALVGVPASLLLNQLQNLVLQGGLLIGIGVGASLVVRRIPAGGGGALARLPALLRLTLAIAVDVALIATVVVGVLTIVGGVLAVAYPTLPVAAIGWWVELLVIVVVITVFYSVATGRGLKATAGETLMATSYLTRGGTVRGRANMERLSRNGLDKDGGAGSELVRMAEIFRSLADARRLQVVLLLLQQSASTDEVRTTLRLSADHADFALRDLEKAGLVVGEGERSDRRYQIASDHVRMGLAELLTHPPARPDIPDT
jgi:membrane-associated protein